MQGREFQLNNGCAACHSQTRDLAGSGSPATQLGLTCHLQLCDHQLGHGLTTHNFTTQSNPLGDPRHWQAEPGDFPTV